MRSVVFAYQDVGYACLEVLFDMGAEVAAVLTHDDDPGERIWFRSVRALATERGIPVFAPERIDDAWVTRLRAWDPDFLFSFYYRRLLPAAALATARHGAFNLHGSLLPRYRGRCPVNWVLIHGEQETGVTLHHMVAKADAGDIVAQRAVPIALTDTAQSLYGKLTAAAAVLLREVYPQLCAGTAPRRPQDHARATTFGGRRPADGRIEWGRGALDVFNLIRAVTHPYPGAFTHWRGRRLFVWSAEPPVEAMRSVDAAAPATAAPGTIVAIDDGVLVQTGTNRLRIRRLQLDGEDELDADAWARRHEIGEGTVLE
jgi:methionyl-tRNA formyltransferase